MSSRKETGGQRQFLDYDLARAAKKLLVSHEAARSSVGASQMSVMGHTTPYQPAPFFEWLDIAVAVLETLDSQYAARLRSEGATEDTGPEAVSAAMERTEDFLKYISASIR